MRRAALRALLFVVSLSALALSFMRPSWAQTERPDPRPGSGVVSPAEAGTLGAGVLAAAAHAAKLQPRDPFNDAAPPSSKTAASPSGNPTANPAENPAAGPPGKSQPETGSESAGESVFLLVICLIVLALVMLVIARLIPNRDLDRTPITSEDVLDNLDDL